MASLGYMELIISLSCFLILFRFLKRNRSLPFNWPFLGMSPTIILNFYRGHEKITDVLKCNEGTFVLKGPWFTNTDKLITCDLANAHHVLSTNFSNYPKGTDSKRVFDVMGDFLFNADHDEWNSHRKMIRTFFGDPRYVHSTMEQDTINLEKGLIPVLNHISKEGKLVDLQDIFNRFMLDSACMLATGYNPGSLAIGFPETPLAEAIDIAADTVFNRFNLPEWLWKFQRRIGFGLEKKMSQATKTLDEILEEYVRKKREDIGRGFSGFDALTFFMTRDDFQGSKILPHHILRDIVLLLITGGRDTVASTLSWYFWLVSQNERVVSKIREEIRNNSQFNGSQEYRLFNSDEVNKLPYLHATFCETLRLYPPTYQVRVPVKDDILPTGHIVTPKMKVIFTWYALGRMPCIWGEDCLEFKPERWISEKGEFKNELSTKHLFSFSNGPRVCPGKSDAFSRMKVIASAIIHNFNVKIEDGHPISPALSVILCMDPGLMVRIANRWA